MRSHKPWGRPLMLYFACSAVLCSKRATTLGCRPGNQLLHMYQQLYKQAQGFTNLDCPMLNVVTVQSKLSETGQLEGTDFQSKLCRICDT